MVRCALTGTPGTGKTSISKLLNKKIIHLSDYYESSSDGKADSGEWLIELDLLNDIIQKLDTEDAVFEGHVSHYLDNMDLIVILRCDPKILKKRLEKRTYSKDKIRENLEAEAMNIIYSEAKDNIGEERIFELDTTKNLVGDNANILKGFMNGNIKLEETFDYSERIMDWY